MTTYMLGALVVLHFLTSCNYTHENEDNWSPETEVVDSVEFKKIYHYWRGYNFIATDSIHLYSRPPFAPHLAYTPDSTILVNKDDAIIVEDIKKDTTSKESSVWVKIAVAKTLNNTFPLNNEIASSGWIKETTLRENVVPDTPISKIIHRLGSNAFKMMLLIIGLFAIAFGTYARKRISRINISYPYYQLLLITLNISIVIHRSIWHFKPETWIEYYYAPSLNPINSTQPLIINTFVLSFWLLIILTLSVADAIRQQTEDSESISMTLGKMLYEIILTFSLFSVLCPFMLLYPVSILFWIYLVVRKRHTINKGLTNYTCGNCGLPLKQLGKCPHCGALNIK